MSARITAFMALAILVAACARNLETFDPPLLDYSDRQPIRLAVDQVGVQSAYRPPGRPPFVEHTLVLTPEAAARRLLERRLQAVGGAGSVQAVILDAAVEQEPLAMRSGITGWLTTEAAARLRGRLKVRVERLDDLGNVVETVSTAVSRTRSIPEDTPYAERQEIAFELVRDLTDDLDAGLVANIRENFQTIIGP